MYDDVEREVRSRVAVGISNLPLPLDPSAILRFKPSFLICIATCFLKFAAVFVSF